MQVSRVAMHDVYHDLALQLSGIVAGERDAVANAANAAAVLFHGVADLNWAGFYFLKGGELVVGPFQGQPACTRIALGRGVCGTAAAARTTLRVDDVHSFAGHIACDTASASELVVPLVKDGVLVGVLDLDSPHLARFTAADAADVEALAAIYLAASDFP